MFIILITFILAYLSKFPLEIIRRSQVLQGIRWNEVDVPDVERPWFNEKNPARCVRER